MKRNLPSWKKGYRLLLKFKRIVGILLLTLIVIYFFKSHALKIEEYFLLSETNIIKLNLEIAENISDIKKGLSNRDHLAKDNGMLFIFDKPKNLRFWMNNTRIPLDLFYLDKDLIIREIHYNLKPYSKKIIESRLPYSYALEVNAGFTDYYNVKPGDKLIKASN
ncbi:DUF192 domain-containing protein [Candidatus Jidaibacter acanthamoebae]|uniref:DUF192 domain-containing protein n=1 Tax=Candidatus Jidaibacter acanthamoebae TaxID=86105 RepID=UPI00083C9E08|nr:DUF192 domain-containing protein [Candidatus Jidaibacter acanthamoeba]